MYHLPDRDGLPRYEWWAREARICAEDGHWDAAAAAYAQALACAESPLQRELAQALLDGAQGERARNPQTDAQAVDTGNVTGSQRGCDCDEPSCVDYDARRPQGQEAGK